MPFTEYVANAIASTQAKNIYLSARDNDDKENHTGNASHDAKGPEERAYQRARRLLHGAARPRAAAKRELTKRFPTAQNPVSRVPPEALKRVGNHHVKHYLFDNDQRLVMILSFDGTWDKYIDDALTVLGPDNFLSWLQHCNEIPEGAAHMSVAQLKEVLSSAQVQAFTYIEVIPDMTIQEIAKAQELMKAFQQVLDSPGAAQALKNPALKTLLDKAAA